MQIGSSKISARIVLSFGAGFFLSASTSFGANSTSQITPLFHYRDCAIKNLPIPFDVNVIGTRLKGKLPVETFLKGAKFNLVAAPSGTMQALEFGGLTLPFNSLKDNVKFRIFGSTVASMELDPGFDPNRGGGFTYGFLKDIDPGYFRLDDEPRSARSRDLKIRAGDQKWIELKLRLEKKDGKWAVFDSASGAPIKEIQTRIYPKGDFFALSASKMLALFVEPAARPCSIKEPVGKAPDGISVTPFDPLKISSECMDPPKFEEKKKSKTPG